MNAVNEPAASNHLDSIQQATALYASDSCQAYEAWRRAYDRGLVTAAELSRLVVLYESETTDRRSPAVPTLLNPRRITYE